MKPIHLMLLLAAFSAQATEPDNLRRLKVPPPPWPQGDERGMANQIGPATFAALRLAHAAAGREVVRAVATCARTPCRSRRSPGPTRSSRRRAPAFRAPRTPSIQSKLNEDAEPGPAGHADGRARRTSAPSSSPGTASRRFRPRKRVYYGGFTQKDVKPTPDSPLLKLGIDKVPPIITSAVLLDAKAYKKAAMKDGELVSAKDLEGMLKAQGLAGRGVLPGDVVYVRTGWGDHWRDPDTEKFYYTKAPGLSFDAAQWLAEKRIVAIALDTPFVDTVAEGMLMGKAGPAPGTPPGLPFAVHHHMLAQAGIHLIENAKLDELARRPRVDLLHPDPAAARQGRGRVGGAPGRDRCAAYKSWTKMRSSPITETSHTAVRSQGMPAR